MPPRSRTPAAMTSFVQTSAVAPRVVQRFKERNAMAVVLRNVADHNWGWFSREDERMHLQTLEKGALTGPNRAKVWLEDKGKRICTHADGKLSGADLKKLQAKVKADRDHIEELWIHFMIQNDWIKAELKGSEVTITAYPKSHNRYERKIDLRHLYPGAYKGPDNWDEKAPNVDWDREHGMLAVGHQKNLDDRIHIEVREFLFTD